MFNLKFNMRKLNSVLLFLCLTLLSDAQSPVLPVIFETEKSLREKIILLRAESANDEKSDSLNQEILTLFSGVLAMNESFFYTWPELDMIGKVLSADQKVKVFTWHRQNSKGEYSYSGIIQQRIPIKKENDEILIHILSDNSGNITSQETQFLAADNWLGALYYSIKDLRFRRQTYYVLLGFDFNTVFSNKKIIEILKLDDNKVVFGGEIKKESNIVRRLIFEYSSEIVMTLRFDQKLQKIVFDHLAPIDPMFQGVHRFYVPNGSYDALVFQKGEFRLIKDVDARNY